MHRLGGAKALPDDLRQTDRYRSPFPILQARLWLQALSPEHGSLQLMQERAAGAREERIETLQVSTLSGLLLKSCRCPELLRQPSGCVVGTGIVMWTPVAGGEKENELTQSPGGKRWIPQLITSK